MHLATHIELDALGHSTRVLHFLGRRLGSAFCRVEFVGEFF
jgi:hypothetical protein